MQLPSLRSSLSLSLSLSLPRLIHTSARGGWAALFLCLLTWGAPIQAQAQAAGTEALQTLLLRNNCVACHLIDKRKYGPTMNEVSARYARDSAAPQTLAKKIKEGGSGVWGDDVMPPQPLVRDADLKAMVELILALKP